MFSVRTPSNTLYQDGHVLACHISRHATSSVTSSAALPSHSAMSALPHQQSTSAYRKPNEAYFFTYVKQERTTKSGHWESSGPDEPIMHDNKIVGFKRLFVFYSGEERSNWIMHEYRVNPGLISANAPNIALKRKIDSYVICKIQLKENKENTSSLNSSVDETFQWDTEIYDED
ncbi:hypothetical protein JRO89_XS05G0031400 [Xanthoceras sorbifolium]|uniref:NAC domain-containing protein n=1 Tax=Xanthoceras sorbifolium TaxID=99658 RepID=A0ABQ8I056_9ROSI|nr:hypothetical protein JRO89_XS05G0031400 [Xanthoceras sorbifolium]